MQNHLASLPDNLKNTDENVGFEYPIQLDNVELTGLQMHRIPWHWHGEMEAIVVQTGEIWFFADDTKLRLPAGQGILINQNIMHSVHPVDKNVSSSLYTLKFHPSFLFGYGNLMMSSKYLSPVLHSSALKIIKLHQEDSWHQKLLDAVNHIISVNQSKKFGFELVTKSYLCQLWSFLLEKAIPEKINVNSQAPISLDENRVKTGLMYIQEHYSEHITLDKLADFIHVSKSECCRCFKRILQFSPFEYIMRFRILEAATLIQQNDPKAYTISSLAFSVGFNNTSYFNKLFKQYLYCTPSEYKHKTKNDSLNKNDSFNSFIP